MDDFDLGLTSRFWGEPSRACPSESGGLPSPRSGFGEGGRPPLIGLVPSVSYPAREFTGMRKASTPPKPPDAVVERPSVGSGEWVLDSIAPGSVVTSSAFEPVPVDPTADMVGLFFYLAPAGASTANPSNALANSALILPPPSVP